MPSGIPRPFAGLNIALVLSEQVKERYGVCVLRHQLDASQCGNDLGKR
jgi:hypothetical protein